MLGMGCKVVKNDRVLQAILMRCTEGEPLDWRLNLCATDFTTHLTAEEAAAWPVSFVEGHILLLGDGEYVELRSSGDGPCIVRVTLAGHDLLEQLRRKQALRDNPFLR